MKYIQSLSQEEKNIFKNLNSPRKIQDFLNSIPINFEQDGDTLISPRRVIKENKAHCLEGALLAAAILWFHGQKPLLMDLKTVDSDYYHMVTLFLKNKFWGAISKTNHPVLRYREPVYKTPRELAMSYFHEYYLNDGAKTLRSYSSPFDLSKLRFNWVTSENNLWEISDALENAPHYKILDRKMISSLRRADAIEIKASNLVEWKDSTSQPNKSRH